MGRTADRSRVPRSCHWREEKEKEKEKERERERERERTRKMEGDASDKKHCLHAAAGRPAWPVLPLDIGGHTETTPISQTACVNALRLRAFFENLRHSNVAQGGGPSGTRARPNRAPRGAWGEVGLFF